MKGIAKFLIGMVLGIVLGWGLGFLRIPLIERNASFWVGSVTCLALVVFIVGLVIVWNKNARLVRSMDNSPAGANSPKPMRTYAVIWLLVGLFIVLGGSVSSWMIYQQNKLFEAQAEHQNQKIQEQSELIESIRKSNLIFLMDNVLDNVDDELAHNPDGLLSAATIARVAALSYSFKPYAYFAGDSLAKKPLSPERGQLLLALAIMNIDSASFAKVKQGAPFAGADLREADLRGRDLSGANLKGADLRLANLSGANLKGADLRGADLWGANLNAANLSGANLGKADLRWAEINSADLKLANLNGADLTSAKLRKADGTGATFHWVKMGSALLNEANLVGVDLRGAVLTKVNLSKADLRESNLIMTDMNDAHLEGATLTEMRVDQDWATKIDQWHVTGAKEIQAGYEVVSDTSGRYQGSKFMLMKRGE